MRLPIMLGLVTALSAASALAQPASARRGQEQGVEQREQIIYRKHTIVRFGDDIIDGDLATPDLAYIRAEKAHGNRSLIERRESFRREILESVP